MGGACAELRGRSAAHTMAGDHDERVRVMIASDRSDEGCRIRLKLKVLDRQRPHDGPLPDQTVPTITDALLTTLLVSVGNTLLLDRVTGQPLFDFKLARVATRAPCPPTWRPRRRRSGAHLEVQVRPGAVPGAADRGDRRTPRHRLSGPHRERRQVGVEERVTTADVDRDDVRLLRKCHVHGVGALHDDDARVFAQFPFQYAVAGVDRVDARGTALEQAIDELERLDRHPAYARA